MAEFVNEKLGARFTVPDTITVRAQLAYYSTRQLADTADLYEANWRAALGVLKDWKCELVPDPAEVKLEETTDRQIALLVMWTANSVAAHMLMLGDIPKASSPAP